MEKGILRNTAAQKGLKATHPDCGRKVECYGREASEKKMEIDYREIRSSIVGKEKTY